MTPFQVIIASKLTEQGYKVLTSGWPDFCAIKEIGDETEVRFIEAHGRGDAIQINQKKIHEILNILGLEVEVVQEDINHRMQYPPSLASGVHVVRKHLIGRPAVVSQVAIAFLQNELKTGPKIGRDVLRKATELKIGRSTIYRTKDAMNVAQKRIGRDIVWELPAAPTEESIS